MLKRVMKLMKNPKMTWKTKHAVPHLQVKTWMMTNIIRHRLHHIVHLNRFLKKFFLLFQMFVNLSYIDISEKLYTAIYCWQLD